MLGGLTSQIKTTEMTSDKDQECGNEKPLKF